MCLHHRAATFAVALSRPERSLPMSMVITETCINCGNCEPICPNQAISAGDIIYLVAQERCTECVGAFDKPQCVESCPIGDCITVDPAHTEPQEVLHARYQQLHPN
jgi:ferredoxin